MIPRMTAQYFQKSVLVKATGSATPIINRSNWDETPLPIPPLAVQHRIVAKVDELMALCDELKEKFGAGRSAQARLATTLIESVLRPSRTGDEWAGRGPPTGRRLAGFSRGKRIASG